MSSDAKALTQGENNDNYIGKRFSWIKMSTPSIESLRQAFLDPESRICLEPRPPQVTHTHIQSIEINNTKFLKDQTVVLSPYLNCLIGGRGSGKSMLFESMRLGLRGETAFKDVSEHVAVLQINRLRGTFQNDTRVLLHVFHDDLEDDFVVDNSGMAARVENRDLADPSTVFRRLEALIFSQEEITQLARQQKSLLDFIDNLARDRIEGHRNRAREIIERLKITRQVDDKIRRLDGELSSLKQEVEELGRQLAAKTTVQEELKKHRAAQEAKRYLDKLSIKAEETNNRLTAIAEELEAEPPPLGSRVENFPDPDFFRQAEEKISAAYQGLALSLKIASEALVTSVANATSKHADWPNVHRSIEKTEKDFHAACEDKGLTIEEAEKLRETEQQHRVKKAACQAKQAERDGAAKGRTDVEKLLEELTQCWLAETQTRQEILDEITGSYTMPRTESGEAIVKTSLIFAGNRDNFLKLWGELSPARNTKVGRLWDHYSRDGAEDNIGDKIFNAFLQSHAGQENEAKVGNPIQFLEMNWNNEQEWPAIAHEFRDDITRVRKEKREKWFELMMTRISDAADLTLLRSDGSKAGSFQRGDLSTGQKNTAILSLLLARGTGPVLIDQPEDELVYALKAEGGRGTCLSQGGLDRPDVARAVLNIMEGSEEAFRRRQEKYHF
ncbi:MAG: AAA family ATPase [Pseudomonadota bacterium]